MHPFSFILELLEFNRGVTSPSLAQPARYHLNTCLYKCPGMSQYSHKEHKKSLVFDWQEKIKPALFL